jgi:hypothetical protein
MSTHSESESKSLSDWISQAEAARMRGTSRQAIHRLVIRGRLATLKVGDRRFVSKSQIAKLVAEPAGRKARK